MKQPLISIIIPAYNHEKFIEETIRSIWNQKYQNLEIIIIDDGSKDGTFEIAKSMQAQSPVQMHVFHQENQGLNKTLNKGISLAKGEFIAVIASDDKFALNRFETQLTLFEKNSNLQVVYGNGRYLRKNGVGKRIYDQNMQKLLNQKLEVILDNICEYVPMPLALQTFLIKTEFLKNVGGMDETLLLDDWPLNIRIFQYLLKYGGEFAFVDEDLVYYRMHENNTCKDIPRLMSMIIGCINKYTPLKSKSKALARAYWQFGLGELTKKPLVALNYLITSQKYEFNILRIINLIITISLKYPLKAFKNKVFLSNNQLEYFFS